MSKSTELPKNSISSAIFGLQDTLLNIKQQWKPLEEKPEIKQPNGNKRKCICVCFFF